MQKFPWYQVVLNNLYILTLWSVIVLGLSPFAVWGVPFLSIFWAVLFVVMMGFVLRKHVCTTCVYYGERCPYGWGKLTSLLFQKGVGDELLGFKLALVFHMGFGAVLPFVLMLIAVLVRPTSKEIAFFVLFLLLTFVGFPLRRWNCSGCERREQCPGAAVQ